MLPPEEIRCYVGDIQTKVSVDAEISMQPPGSGGPVALVRPKQVVIEIGDIGQLIIPIEH